MNRSRTSGKPRTPSTEVLGPKAKGSLDDSLAQKPDQIETYHSQFSQLGENFLPRLPGRRSQTTLPRISISWINSKACKTPEFGREINRGHSLRMSYKLKRLMVETSRNRAGQAHSSGIYLRPRVRPNLVSSILAIATCGMP